MLFIVLTIFFISSFNDIQCQLSNPFIDIYTWRNLTFLFPSRQDEINAIIQNKYIAGNTVPIDVDVYYPKFGSPRVFITFPRFLEGTPITLGTVSGPFGTEGAPIQAYPNYQSQSSQGIDCDGLTSVFRVTVDKCDRLWVLDSGGIDDTRYCPPQLISYDLKTDKILSRYRFPRAQYLDDSVFLNPVCIPLIC